MRIRKSKENRCRHTPTSGISKVCTRTCCLLRSGSFDDRGSGGDGSSSYAAADVRMASMKLSID